MVRSSQPAVRADVIALSSCLLLSLLLLNLPNHARVRVAYTLASVIVTPYQNLRNFAEDVLQVRAENARLAAQVEVLELRAAVARRATADSSRAAAVHALDPGVTGPLAPCQVIARQRARYASMVQIVSRDPLQWRSGLAVIDPRGYIGRVHTVMDSRAAWVELLTSPDMALGVEIVRTGLVGVLRPRADTFVLEMVGRDEDVESGDVVVTSGIAEIREDASDEPRDPVPRGLPVGVVREVSAPTDQIFKQIVVEPLADFDRNEVVFVVGASRLAPSASAPSAGNRP